MNYKIVTALFLLLQISAYSLTAQDVKTNGHLNSKVLKQKAKEAQTPEQLRQLAFDYRREAASFRNDAEQENQELARRIQQAGGRTYKYPSPVDSARNLYQYYLAKADEMGNKAVLAEGQAASKL
jgi:hypothetical protein